MIEHDPNHPYLRRLVGCGHGRLWAEPCPECEIAGLMDEYTRAVRTVARVRDRLRAPERRSPARTTADTSGPPIAPPASIWRAGGLLSNEFQISAQVIGRKALGLQDFDHRPYPVSSNLSGGTHLFIHQ